jgi:transposase IS200 family protein
MASSTRERHRRVFLRPSSRQNRRRLRREIPLPISQGDGRRPRAHTKEDNQDFHEDHFEDAPGVVGADREHHLVAFRSVEVVTSAALLSRTFEPEFEDCISAVVPIEKRYGNNVPWSPSYFAASCSGAPLGIIEQYVEQQRPRSNRALYPRPKGPGLYGPGGNFFRQHCTHGFNSKRSVVSRSTDCLV